MTESSKVNHAIIMTDHDNDKQLSSPSGSSSRSSVRTPQQPGKVDSATSRHRLLIQKYPSHVFDGEDFRVDFMLEPQPDDSPPPNVDVRVRLAGNSKATKLTVLHEPRLSNTRLTGNFVCRFDEPEAVGHTFRIQIESNHAGIQSALTAPIAVVRAKLHVEPGEGWENVWFKDEGGREKCMEVVVTAVGKNEQAYRENVFLNVALYYESGIPVTNQGILRLLGRTLVLNKATGSTRVRYRVEDVSKNHQKQSFVLQINAKERLDIAPTRTPPVVIRSKRNKRPRHQPTPNVAGTPSTATSATIAFDNPGRVREALQGILQWSEDVVTGIYPLQWQVMGYAHNPDGSLDYNRPYHNMQNPNETFHRILTAYNESTREQLQVLRQALDSPRYDLPSQPPFHAGGARMLPPFLPSGASSSAMMPPYGMVPPIPPLLPPPQAKVDPYAYPQQQQRLMNESSSFRPNSKRDLESMVEYVLAKQYKAFSTGEPLGFPAYSLSKEMVGFFRVIGNERHFVPVNDLDAYFGPAELRQATVILEESLASKSKAVHSLKEWGSMSNLLDHALVYDWSKDIDNEHDEEEGNKGSV